MVRSRLFNALAAVALLVLGVSCSADQSPTEARQPSASLLGGVTSLASPLLSCPPQSYASNSQVIGPEGGTLVVGKHKLVIPRGSLSAPVLISGEAPVDTVVSVRFKPEGLQFNPQAPARLTLDYSACPLVSNLLPRQIVYTDEKLSILEFLLSLDDLLRHQVSANVKHFSRYAVAW